MAAYVPAVVWLNGVQQAAALRFDAPITRRAGRGRAAGSQPMQLIIFEGSADRRTRVSKRFEVVGSQLAGGAARSSFFGSSAGLAARPAHADAAGLVPMRMFLNIGSAELVVVFIVAFILFGPQGVTDVARTAGKALKTFKRISEEATNVMDKLIEDEEFAQKATRAVSKAASVATAKKGPAAAAAVAGAAASTSGAAEAALPPPPFLAAAAAKGAAAAEGMAKRVVVIGPPACGKGTQCKRVAAELGYVHVCAGDLLREEVATGSDVGLQIKSYMDMGWIVPGDVTAGLVLKRLASWDCAERGVVLDGYPRSVEQADALRAAGWEPDRVVLFEAPDEVLVRRVTGRRVDPETGKIYHLEFNPPPEDDAELLGRLVQRPDDTEGTVATRLEQFKEANEAILARYEPDLLFILDADRSPDAVFASFAALLQPRPADLDDEGEGEGEERAPAGPGPAAVAAAAAAAGVGTLAGATAEKAAPVPAPAPAAAARTPSPRPQAKAAAGEEGKKGGRRKGGGRSGGKGSKRPE